MSEQNEYCVRRAESKDTEKILDLLRQVNLLHHEGRPDLFRGPATKYNAKELAEIFADERRPVFVCVDHLDQVLAYAFCVMKETRGEAVMVDHSSLYIDDICVDQAVRGQNLGRTIYEAVLAFAREQGCYHVTLNVWECNPSARRFYESLGMHVQKTTMEQVLRP